MSDNERFITGVTDPDNAEDVKNIIASALQLEAVLYSHKDYGPYIFQLRKSLEGIWGHELPEVEGPHGLKP